MKLWQKNTESLQAVTQFTVGNDTVWDVLLAPYDVLASIAHATMLAEVGLLTQQEKTQLVEALQAIYASTQNGQFTIAHGVEDVHSQIEFLLTQQLGDTGKKIHSARSRNDQVLVALKLFIRSQITDLVTATQQLFTTLQTQSEQYKHFLLPGYTHLQIAMPSSFGLWLGAYAEALVDDVETLLAAYRVANKNPLGSAAGYGSSFPINRTRTTELLGFETLNYNVVYAQMTRGKTEKVVAQALANIADTLAKLSMDACLYVNQNFNFLSFPAELTTGSSIMPHKKNPDVFEIVRGKCNVLRGLPNTISLLTTNLPSGYHRELQLLKNELFPAFDTLKTCMQMLQLMFENMVPQPHIMQQPLYQYAFSVEVVNQLVLQGVPFRDAYKKVGIDIENGNYQPSQQLNHTHEGSLGNLCNTAIADELHALLQKFNFEKVQQATQQLLAPQ
ncbi:MAG: argininosuccinate lyase [Bacteroidetes bacterium]|nr:MAG: argininosuccinate lyase [Bacteroidota bacterium]TAF93138.1 MAG: argininosuccinate lyase [Bacteroidota bacterium]